MDPLRFIKRKLAALELIPSTRMGWFALYAALAWVVLYALRRVIPALGSILGGFYTLVAFVACIALLIVGFRWFRTKLMWRLRNRLVVTYIFIGVIPLVLLASMALLTAYLFAGQFSSYVVTSDLQGEIKRMSAINTAAARHIEGELKSGKPMSKVELDTNAGAVQIVTYFDGAATVLQRGDASDTPSAPPDGQQINSIVLDNDKLYLRAVTTLDATPKVPKLVVLSSLPLNAERLDKLVGEMGRIAVYGRANKPRPGGVSIRVKESSFQLDTAPKVEAGSVPDAKSALDVQFLPPGALLQAYDWQTRDNTQLFMTVRTRPSVLYGRLFRTLGEMTAAITAVLAFVAIVFAIIELLALFVGVRLTRTMTRSVAELYDATQNVNRGDFSHRIRVVSRDQLAALETSFNSMTESLEKLIAEQKEKQRIESELAIAKEVQALLFPRDLTELEKFEVHGICRPARTVSGDYYDFLPVSGTRLGIAVGDISGKGISAALLMATVHAFVRAYTLVDKIPTAAAAAASAQTIAQSMRNGQISPGTLMAMLNQQMYESTPTEKYATMFLGFFDQNTREFNYSNAGHLPPLLIGGDGNVRQLDAAGGTVVGLFGGMAYGDAAIEMRPGDIFVAYSDGVTEPENEYGEFGVERLAQLIQENRRQSLARISDVVIASVMDWIGANEQPDDVTLVLARAR